VEWQAVAAVAAVASSAAAAVSAVSSWRAASASRATSRDALEALAVGLRPKLQATVNEFSYGTNVAGIEIARLVVATVKNFSDHEAADIEVEARLRNGVVLKGEHPWLRPSRFRIWEHFDDENDVRITLKDGSLESEVGVTIVRFSDARRLARYERKVSHMVKRFGPDKRGITGESRWTDVREERITGP
jgi:hypothetical protein